MWRGLRREASGVGIAQIELLESRALLSVLPVNGEFRANSYTTSDQVLPRAAAAPDGRFVLVWMSSGQAGSGSGRDIYARLYSAAGDAVAPEFLVNTFTTGNQDLPAVAMDNAGNFVVVWHSNAQDGSGLGVYGQRFDASGVAQGGEFAVNTYTISHQEYPTVAMDADGDFVVAWESYGQDGSSYGVYAQRYSSTGSAQGGEFRVNVTTSGVQYSTSTACDDAGNFVITWSSGPDTAPYLGDIYIRRYDSAGIMLSGEVLANTFTSDSQNFPWIACDADGDFVVAWQSFGQDSNRYGIYAQRFTASGMKAGAELAVNTHVAFDQDFVSASMDASGNFVLVWESALQDGSGYGTYGQAYSADGVRSGSEFRANTLTTEDQSFPAVALADNGHFMVSWQSRNQDGSAFGIYAQRYQLDVVAPMVSNSSFHFATKPHTISFTFSEDVSASLMASDVTVINLAGGPALALQLDSYNTGTNTATFSFPGVPNGVLPDGQYRATVNAAGVTDPSGNPLAANYIFNFFFLSGDANHDGSVNLIDFNILAGNFGLSPRDFTQGDFSYDGLVNLVDFNILAGKFGSSVGPQTFSAMRIATKAPPPMQSLREDLLA